VCYIGAFSQVGIGTTTPDQSSILDVSSTTGGFLLPRMNENQRDAISNPATGLIIYLIEVNYQCLQVYNGSYWENIYCPTNNTIPSATNVSISGILNVGENITGTYLYQDNESDAEDVSIFQWYRADDASGTNEMAIPGATNENYTVSTNDNAKYLSFGVIPVAATGALTGLQVRSNFFGPVGTVMTTTARFNEFHYDNVGTDVNEFIEIRIAGDLGSQPADLSQYSVTLYNGSDGLSYLTETLNNLNRTCDGSNCYYVWDSIAIQNGAPDGFALSGPSGLIEFLSYEGTFTANDGIAAGALSTNVGVFESNSTDVNGAIERSLSGVWSVSASSNTKGAANSL
jgi:hypothetical protein